MKNVNGRINQRANMANKAKAHGLEIPKEGLFYWSFNINGDAMVSDLYRYERLSNYNNHTGFYN